MNERFRKASKIVLIAAGAAVTSIGFKLKADTQSCYHQYANISKNPTAAREEYLSSEALQSSCMAAMTPVILSGFGYIALGPTRREED